MVLRRSQEPTDQDRKERGIELHEGCSTRIVKKLALYISKRSLVSKVRKSISSRLDKNPPAGSNTDCLTLRIILQISEQWYPKVRICLPSLEGCRYATTECEYICEPSQGNKRDCWRGHLEYRCTIFHILDYANSFLAELDHHFVLFKAPLLSILVKTYI